MRPIKIATAALIVVLMSSVIACGSSSSQGIPTGAPTGTPQETSEFTTYTNNSLGFSISGPVSWTPQQVGNDISFVPPSTCSGASILAVVSKKEASGQSLQNVYQTAKSAWEGMEGYNLISEDVITVSDLPAIKLVFNSCNLAFCSQMMMCVLVKGQTCWNIFFSCESSCWSTYEGTFNTMLDSFYAL